MIITADWVVPVSAAPIERGFLAVEAGRIAEVGSQAELSTGTEDQLDFGPAIITPGLINPHTHLELTAYAGRLPRGPLWDWLVGLVKLRREPGRVLREQAGVEAGAWASLRAGVTCVGDISRENIAWPVLKQLPLRKVCFAELLSLADQPARTPAELQAAIDEIVEDALLTAGLTPHASYTVSAAHLKGAFGLARETRRPWCTHWAESAEEVRFLRGDVDALPRFLGELLEQCDVHTPRQAPAAYLRDCVGEAAPGLLAHYNYLTDDDLELLADGGHCVVYCPRAHHFFGHPPHPFARLRAAGVPVTFGTDSAASNDDLSILAELRHVRRHVKAPPSAADLLELVTLRAARALGLDQVTGTLERGKAADFVVWPLADSEDPLVALIDTVPAPREVWVAGQRVWVGDTGRAPAESR